MITILLRMNGKEKRLSFSKREITVGPENSGADITLPLREVDDLIVRIDEKNGRYTIVNLAHDPNVTFNQNPFGSRTLQPGCKIEIQGIELQVLDIDDFVQESHPISPERTAKRKRQEREREPLPLLEKAPPKEKERPKYKWLMWVSATALFLLTILGGVTVGIYLSGNMRGEEEELHAAKNISDIAAALLYAQVHHETPHNSNWSDPKFLNRIFTQIIPATTNTCCELQTDGKLKNLPYIVRIYTNEDASRFLLMAQPSASLTHWFSPQDSILVDSNRMELRKMKDIQPINRLLNTDEFTDGISRQVTLLLQEGELISLYTLGRSSPELLFAPPTELAILSPGAQNYIYNAPRYHKLTENIIKRATTKEELQKEEMAELQQLANIPELVFYTTDGIKSAMNAHVRLSDHLATKNVIVGYFSYDPITQLPKKTHLLLGKGKETAYAELAPNTTQNVQYESDLYKKLSSIAGARREQLLPIGEKIGELIRQNGHTPTVQFKTQLVAYLTEYEKVDRQQQRKISKDLSHLYETRVVERSEMTESEFISYLKATGLESFLKKKRESRYQELNPLQEAAGSLRK